MAVFLVIADSLATLTKIEATLNEDGHRVLTARTGADGEALAKTEGAEVIFADYRLPDMSAHELAGRLEDDPELSATSLVIVTGKSDIRNRAFVGSKTAISYLTRPFSPLALHAIASFALHKREQLLENLGKKPAPPAPAASDRPNLSTSTEGAALWCDLSQIPLPDVFQLVQMQGHSGLIEIRNDACSFQIFLHRGRVVAVLAEDVRDEFALPRFLLDYHVVENEEALATLNPSGKSVRVTLESLRRHGGIDREALQRALEGQCRELVYMALRTQGGNCRFLRNVDPPVSYAGSLVQIEVTELLFEGMRRDDEWRVIELYLDYETVFARTDRDCSSLDASQRAMMEWVDGQRTVREILRLARQRPFEGCSTLSQLARAHHIRAGAI